MYRVVLVLFAEITAANVANVCTFAVMGDADIDQTVIDVSSLYTYSFVVIQCCIQAAQGKKGGRLKPCPHWRL